MMAATRRTATKDARAREMCAREILTLMVMARNFKTMVGPNLGFFV
jgi:hypothetical protein